MPRAAPRTPSFCSAALRQAIAAILFLSVCSLPAQAKVALKGGEAALQIDARDSSVAEVLTALERAYGLHYRSAIVLNQPVSGSFKGPILQVLSHLLRDYDFIVKTSADARLQVSIFRLAGKDSDRVISTLITSYPDPMWRARSYSRPIPVIPPRDRRHPWLSR